MFHELVNEMMAKKIKFRQAENLKGTRLLDFSRAIEAYFTAQAGRNVDCIFGASGDKLGETWETERTKIVTEEQHRIEGKGAWWEIH